MINLLLTSSDLYYPFLRITLYSIIKNNSNEKLNFFILSYNISSEHKEKIYQLENDSISIDFIEVSNLVNDFNLNEIQRDYLINSPIPITSRLFLTKLLPSNVDKILSLDSDVLVVDSIKELWDIDITNYYCAGVKDLMPTAFTESIGLTEKDNYLNTGILLINLKKIREDKKDEEFLDFISNNHDLYMHYDQGIINAVCKGALLPIHPKFNYIGSLHVKNPENTVKWFVDPENYYNKKTLKEAQEETVIYHFCEGALGRPWTNRNHMYYSLYHRYVTESKINEKEIYDFSKEKPLINNFYTLLQTNTFLNKTISFIPSTLTRNITNNIIKKRIHSK